MSDEKPTETYSLPLYSGGEGSSPLDGMEATVSLTESQTGPDKVKAVIREDGDYYESYTFPVTDDDLQVCEWRSTDTLPGAVAQAVSKYGYRVKGIENPDSSAIESYIDRLDELASDILHTGPGSPSDNFLFPIYEREALGAGSSLNDFKALYDKLGKERYRECLDALLLFQGESEGMGPDGTRQISVQFTPAKILVGITAIAQYRGYLSDVVDEEYAEKLGRAAE